MTLMERNDYKADFDPIVHLTEWYSDPSSPTDLFSGFIHDNLHKFFHSVPLPQAELKLLDFGCGPVIANVISASQYVSDIVLAEYTPQSRVLLEQWLKRDPSFTFDWSPHFKYVVQTLEGRSEDKVKEREESLHQKIKAIVPCNITQDPPISQEYAGPYDILICSLVIDVTATNVDEYEEQLRRLSALVKPGGYMLTVSDTTPTDDEFVNDYYMAKDQKFNLFVLSTKCLISLIEKVGFCPIDVINYPNKEADATFTFVSARKIIN